MLEFIGEKIVYVDAPVSPPLETPEHFFPEFLIAHLSTVR